MVESVSITEKMLQWIWAGELYWDNANFEGGEFTRNGIAANLHLQVHHVQFARIFE